MQDRSDEKTVSQLPIYRCLVVQAYEFQNFPTEVKKVFKANKKLNNDKNIMKWIIKSRRQSTVLKQRTL